MRLFMYGTGSYEVDCFMKVGSEFPPIIGIKKFPVINLSLNVVYGRVRLSQSFAYVYGVPALNSTQLEDLLGLGIFDFVLAPTGAMGMLRAHTDNVRIVELVAAPELQSFHFDTSTDGYVLRCDLAEISAVRGACEKLHDVIYGDADSGGV